MAMSNNQMVFLLWCMFFWGLLRLTTYVNILGVTHVGWLHWLISPKWIETWWAVWENISKETCFFLWLMNYHSLPSYIYIYILYIYYSYWWVNHETHGKGASKNWPHSGQQPATGARTWHHPFVLAPWRQSECNRVEAENGGWTPDVKSVSNGI